MLCPCYSVLQDIIMYIVHLQSQIVINVCVCVCRQTTEALLRYHLYVDCMPVQGVEGMSQKELSRVTARAACSHMNTGYISHTYTHMHSHTCYMHVHAGMYIHTCAY